MKDRICKIKQYLNYILRWINQNIPAILRTLLNLQIKLWKALQQANFTTSTSEFLNKIPNRNKISNELFNLFEAEISVEQIIKSINSEANSKFPGNDSHTAEFYKHLSNKLAPVLLDVYNSWGKLGFMGVTFRIGTISAIYKKDDEIYISKYTPISLLNLGYKIYPTNS